MKNHWPLGKAPSRLQPTIQHQPPDPQGSTLRLWSTAPKMLALLTLKVPSALLSPSLSHPPRPHTNPSCLSVFSWKWKLFIFITQLQSSSFHELCWMETFIAFVCSVQFLYYVFAFSILNVWRKKIWFRPDLQKHKYPYNSLKRIIICTPLDVVLSVELSINMFTKKKKKNSFDSQPFFRLNGSN